MPKKSQLDSKFWFYLIRKSVQSAVFYLFTWIAYLSIAGLHHLADPYVAFASLLLITGSIMRGTSERRFKSAGPATVEQIAKTITLSSVFVAMGWSTLFIATTHNDPENAPIKLITFLVIAGITGGQSFRLAPVPMLARTTAALTMFPATVFISLNYFHAHSFAIIGMSVFYYAFLHTQIGDIHATLSEAFKNEAQSKNQARVMSGILDGVPGIVSVVDDQLTYRSVNQFGIDFLGFDPTGNRVGWKSENPAFETNVREFFYSPKRQSSFEMEMFHGGRSNWFFISLRKLFAPMNGMIIVSIPIDDLKTAQQEVEAQKAKADYSARLASLGEMAAGIAHEINNPLAIISAKSQFLGRMMTKLEVAESTRTEMADLAGGIVKTIERITKIIKGLRMFAKDGSSDPPSVVSVQHVIDDTVVFCESRFRTAGIQLSVEVEPGIRFCVQSIQVSQVLLNLLNNAHDAVEQTAHAQVGITAKQHGSMIQIRVWDNGPGIPAAIRTKIMQPFFTTKEVGKGTGLGLSISRGIASYHKGSLSLDPRTDRTEFVLELPIESKIQEPKAA